MAPRKAIRYAMGVLITSFLVLSPSPALAQGDEDPAGQTPTEEETRNAFIDLLNDMTELIVELMPGVDLDALGPFAGWASNLVVLLATLFAVYAVFRLIQGAGMTYVTSGGKKEKVKEGKAMMSSALIYLIIAVGLPIVLMIITWFVSFITS